MNIPGFCTAGNIAVINNILWFFSYNHNSIVAYDFESNSIIDCIILDKSNKIESSFNYIMLQNDNLILMPAFEDQIAIFDINSRKTEWLEIKKISGIYEKFECGFIWRGKIYLFPFDYNSVVTVDIKSKWVDYFDINEAMGKNVIDRLYINAMVQIEQLVYFSTKDSNTLMKMDIEKKLVSQLWKGAEDDKIVSVLRRNNNLIVFCDSGKTSEIAPNGNVVNEFIPNSIKWGISRGGFTEGKGYFYIPYNSANPLILINNKKECVELICGQKLSCEWNYKSYSETEIVGNKLVLMNIPESKLLVVNMDSANVDIHILALDQLESERFIGLSRYIIYKTTNNSEVLHEGKKIGLKELIYAL